MNIRSHSTVKDRREALERELSVELKNIGECTVDESVASTRNCENMIGAAQIPMGIAGPLLLNKTEYYIPLATTEGALVASINRGCKAITTSEGAWVDSYKIGATRGPVFKVQSLSQSKELFSFVNNHEDELRSVASETSSHLTLTKTIMTGVGKYMYLRFSFDTQDAMGMNMVTIAADQLSKYIAERTGIPLIAVAGNIDADKKPAWSHAIQHRGIEAWAECTLSVDVLKNILKTTAKKVYEVWLSKCMIGSALSGSIGFNAQMANVLSAMFIATGQDPAHVVEASVGMTTAEVVNTDDLYMSVFMPDLMIGTVGGGTGLGTQKEALSILGVKTSQKLAEVIAGSVLAGEISLLASLSVGTLAQSHQRLGRGGA